MISFCREGEICDFPVIQGEDSQTYAFRRGADRYILRINRSSMGFEKDKFVQQRFATPKLPIPEIVSIGTLADGRAYCVSRRAEGVTLQDLTSSQLSPVLCPVAEAMHAIATADVSATTGFGPFDPNGVGRCATWREFILEPQVYNWPDRTRIDRHLDQIAQVADYCPETRQLVHGDFGSNNVLTDGSCITGVIDWSEALIGDPLYDLANILFWRPWLDCMEQQAQYFEQHEPELLRHRERLRCYQLRIGLNEIYQGIVDEDAQNVAWASSRCDEILRS